MKIFLSIVCVLLVGVYTGQNIRGADYKSLGPDYLPTQNIGFVNACWSEMDSKIVYAGSLYGGLWKGTRNNSNEMKYTWQNISDTYERPGTGISSLEVVPNTNGKVIYIGTQMGGNGRIYTYSNGLLKTENGGSSWFQVGPKIDPRQNKIVDYFKMNPEFPEVMYARIGNEDYYTENGWENWRVIRPPIKNKDQYLHIADVEWKPGTSKVFYLSTRSENNQKAELYRTKDGGYTWEDLTHDIKASNIQMDVIRKKGMEEVLFMAHAEQGAFVQVYDGKTWSKNKNTNGIFNGNGYWHMEFEVNEEDTSVMYLSMTQLGKSVNGGKTFQTISDYFGINTHADIRDLKILSHTSKGQQDVVLMATDGGVSISYPGTENTKSWYNINGSGLSIAQFWGIGISEHWKGLLMGGGQDNGVYTLKNGRWSNQTSGVGDGYEAVISELDSAYALAQGNSPSLLHTYNGSKNWRQVAFPPGPCSNFRRPMWMDKKQHKVWLGHHQLYLKDNSNGKLDAKWEQKTFFPDLKQKNGMLFNQQIHCFAISGEKSENCLLVFSGVLWGNDSLKGKIFFTKNLNESQTEWIDLTRYAPGVNWREITDLTADPNNDHVFYSIWQDIYSGFNSQILKMEISQSLDTILFTDLTYNLPSYPCNKIITENSTSGKIYLATDTGIYFTNYDLLNWGRWEKFENKKSNLPFSVISDLEFNYTENKLYIATYGRGLWSTPPAETGSEKAINLRKNTTWTKNKKLDGKLIIHRGKSLTIDKEVYLTSFSSIELKRNARLIIKSETQLKTNSGDQFELKKIKLGKGAKIEIK